MYGGLEGYTKIPVMEPLRQAILAADITCTFDETQGGGAPDGMYPVNGIIPFYSEVAIVPCLGSVTGVAVIDGASECAYNQHGFPIRPNIPGYREIYMDPMVLKLENSMLVDYSGPEIQVARLDKLMEDVSPRPDICDELGIVTTTSVENDIYGWKVDGVVICRDGEYDDEAIKNL